MSSKEEDGVGEARSCKRKSRGIFLHAHVRKIPQLFRTCKRREAGWGLGMRLPPPTDEQFVRGFSKFYLSRGFIL